MALQAGSSASEFMTPDEWVALGREGALVAVIVRAHGTIHMEKGPSAGKEVDRVAFDLFILDGSRKGEVLLGQDAIGRGIVAPLKRVSVGDEVAYRCGVGNSYGRDYAQLNAPGDLPEAAVTMFEELKVSGGSAPAEKEKVSAGAKSGGSKAKSSGYADEPDF